MSEFKGSRIATERYKEIAHPYVSKGVGERGSSRNYLRNRSITSFSRRDLSTEVACLNHYEQVYDIQGFFDKRVNRSFAG